MLVCKFVEMVGPILGLFLTLMMSMFLFVIVYSYLVNSFVIYRPKFLVGSSNSDRISMPELYKMCKGFLLEKLTNTYGNVIDRLTASRNDSSLPVAAASPDSSSPTSNTNPM